MIISRRLLSLVKFKEFVCAVDVEDTLVDKPYLRFIRDLIRIREQFRAIFAASLDFVPLQYVIDDDDFNLTLHRIQSDFTSSLHQCLLETINDFEDKLESGNSRLLDYLNEEVTFSLIVYAVGLAKLYVKYEIFIFAPYVNSKEFEMFLASSDKVKADFEALNTLLSHEINTQEMQSQYLQALNWPFKAIDETGLIRFWMCYPECLLKICAKSELIESLGNSYQIWRAVQFFQDFVNFKLLNKLFNPDLLARLNQAGPALLSPANTCKAIIDAGKRLVEWENIKTILQNPNKSDVEKKRDIRNYVFKNPEVGLFWYSKLAGLELLSRQYRHELEKQKGLNVVRMNTLFASPKKRSENAPTPRATRVRMSGT